MSSIVCNVFDGSSIPIDCEYQGYHVETGNWSNVYSTELNQISFDTENSDWDGNGVAFPSGDVVLIKCWTATSFCVFSILSTGASVYSIDTQLLESVAPNVSITASDGVVSQTIIANSNTSDLYQWTYNGTVFYHRNSYYGQTIHNEVGIASVDYKFGALDFNAVNFHSFDTYGDYTIECKATNKYGQSTISTTTVRIRNRAPVISVYHTPNFLYTGDATSVVGSVVDIDSTVVSVTNSIDDLLTTASDFTLTSVGTHQYVTTVEWDDGFTNNMLIDTLDIVVSPRPPEITLSSTNNRTVYTFHSEVIPGDGVIEAITYSIQYMAPLSEVWVDVYSEVGAIDQVISFPANGLYEVTATVVDSYNESDSDTESIVAECASTVSLTKYKMLFDKE